jgi:hypothetical protein
MHWRTVKGPTGASTLSTTPAMHALPVSLTPAKTCFTGVNDTGKVGDINCPVSITLVMHDVTGVNDTGDKRFYYRWMILSNFEWTLLRSNIYGWLVFLLIVPLNALANCQRSYWCINVVNDTGKVGDINCPESITPVMHDVTGVNDTGDMLRRSH